MTATFMQESRQICDTSASVEPPIGMNSGDVQRSFAEEEKLMDNISNHDDSGSFRLYAKGGRSTP